MLVRLSSCSNTTCSQLDHCQYSDFWDILLRTGAAIFGRNCLATKSVTLSRTDDVSARSSVVSNVENPATYVDQAPAAVLKKIRLEQLLWIFTH